MTFGLALALVIIGGLLIAGTLLYARLHSTERAEDSAEEFVDAYVREVQDRAETRYAETSDVEFLDEWRKRSGDGEGP